MTRGSTLLLFSFSPVASSSVLPSEEAWDSTSVDERPLRFVALCSIMRPRWDCWTLVSLGSQCQRIVGRYVSFRRAPFGPHGSRTDLAIKFCNA
ncbi:hypothetical protein KC316_g51 [Hortaea werneckii]|nr:hypothetical protein KC316_g51 [Hortaea werneckii]